MMSWSCFWDWTDDVYENVGAINFCVNAGVVLLIGDFLIIF